MTQVHDGVENAHTFDDAQCLDLKDPLAAYREGFIGSDDPGVVAYLDGNSLGRPLKASADRIAGFLRKQWGGRLIRGWDEGWLSLPGEIGDELGLVALGAAAGQTIVGDSTTVMLYKLCRAAVAARPGRTEVILDTDNFPTDRFVLQGIAAECGLTLRWIRPAYDAGVTARDLGAVLSEQTALVVLSHVAYRSGYLADMHTLTSQAHEAGALILWDLCHSAGVVPTELDAWGVDLAVGCSYKYLNGGPGSPAFGYVRREHQAVLRQPIQGWLGSADPFGMGELYEAAAGIRAYTSGTPPIVGMLAMQDMISLIGEVGIGSVRAKSVALTEFALRLYRDILAPLGVTLASPSEARWRGGHITLDHPSFREVTTALWERGVIPDFRNPNGIRLGLSPLSTSFAEVWLGVDAIREELAG
ncbi:aminotransferase class V-fold PLP-dependent enzyme [Paenarthrobacter sp. PH39-S1]|uniref:kynureninase n=1 Tax=Paenarthrobacter sp. PH39-S1 TaxID=3046204 RepID=UPI0024B98FD8|nr:aminotransferase class V-fold PLP-dependent enzyme [Paenarthrobacter sp. PH39-S1]MDJ0356738.1 aminotransferase class V-fold PLP-dependent enzyme [Paenarthrobacter sp. PH39-S1]